MKIKIKLTSKVIVKFTFNVILEFVSFCTNVEFLVGFLTNILTVLPQQKVSKKESIGHSCLSVIPND
jgi:hypothetical protein